MSYIVRLVILIMLMIPTVTITPIKINQKNYTVCDATTDKIVFLGQDDSGKSDIFIKNINTGNETQITTDGLKKTALVMTGNFIAWRQRKDNKHDEIVLFNIGNSTKLTLSEAFIAYFPDSTMFRLTERWLVWFEKGNEMNFYAYELQTGNKIQINETYDVIVSDIVIVGDTVYYTIKSGYNSENKSNEDIVYSINLITKEKTIICNEKGVRILMVGKGDWLAWLDTRNGNLYDLYLYQISKGKEYLIENPAFKPVFLAIGDSFVVYSTCKDKLPGPMYKLVLDDSLKPTVLLSEQSFRTNLKVGNDIILWEEKTDVKKNSPKIYGVHSSSVFPFELTNSKRYQNLIMNKNNIVVWQELEGEKLQNRKENVSKIKVSK